MKRMVHKPVGRACVTCRWWDGDLERPMCRVVIDSQTDDESKYVYGQLHVKEVARESCSYMRRQGQLCGPEGELWSKRRFYDSFLHAWYGFRDCVEAWMIILGVAAISLVMAVVVSAILLSTTNAAAITPLPSG